MFRPSTLIGATAAGILLLVAACHNDELFRPTAITPVDPLFARYVSMGNSITAGFQSGGINDSTQLQSYANLLAKQMHTPFYIPLLNRPGCPPPLVNIFTRTVVGPPLPPALPCALRKPQGVVSPILNNVAVPGAAVEDILSNLSPDSRANILTTLLLGGQTQTQAMRRANPTFVTVWIGNNDVLGAALDGTNPGDTTKITPDAAFASAYAEIVDSLLSTSQQGAVLLGTVRVTAAPFWSFGQVYFGASAGGQLPAAFSVDASCTPSAAGFGGKGDSVLIPMPVGGKLLGAASLGLPVTLFCFDTTYFAGPKPDTFAIRVIAPAEYAKLNQAVASYNAVIRARAADHDWVYLDPNLILDSLVANPAAVRPLPAFGQPCSASPFGTALSCDGIHPSAATHKLLANKLIEAINARYGASLARIP